MYHVYYYSYFSLLVYYGAYNNNYLAVVVVLPVNSLSRLAHGRLSGSFYLYHDNIILYIFDDSDVHLYKQS